MKIGYARVSTKDQNLDLQRDALKSAGCEKIFTDKVSGTNENRKGLDEAFNFVRSGDVLVVWKLDRLGRSLKHLIETVTDLEEKGIGFCSLQESIDTTSSGGRLIFNIFGALAQFEREIIKERTHAGLVAARARGRNGGRPRVMDSHKVAMAKQLMENKDIPVKEVCRTLDVSKATLYRYLKQNGN